ncbi:DUF3187 family protein [Anaeromyxobacter oryzae]|uniref:DUF3187 family protein n=1 Tax=Anaeromyxobacter oryzae TaxID=2918170 RepID=A0ABM7WRW7_9BACT|nr:DUF3187 family protein [Anaeromyxobacter oryzae]BDG02213.1 hypothetical protein AMOR_12090 [Anaeromyxobacter oryzae]
MRPSRCPSVLHALALAALAVAPAATLADGTPEAPAPPRFVSWQDPAPLARPFLQLPFDVPEPLSRGGTEIALRTLYSNTIIRAQTSALSVNVSVESAQPMVVVRQGLRDGLELELEIPGVIDYPGFLARPIKFVDAFVGHPNPLRAGPIPKARVNIVREGGAGIDWSGTGGGAGDVWAGLKGRITAGHGWTPALSWRAAVKVPTAALPFGSGAVDVGGGVLCGWTFEKTALHLTADVVVPGGTFTPARLETRPHAALQIGASRRFATWLSATLQGSVHGSAITGTGMDAVDGASWYVLAGVAAEVTRRTAVTFALVENVLHASHGADITGVLELTWRR